MRARGWEFEEKNVDEDGDALREMLDLSRQSGVPVIAVDGQVIVGFNKQLLDQLLEP